MNSRIRRNHVITILAVLIVLGAMALFARAGGSGSSSGSGSSDGEGIFWLIYIIVRLLFELPFPLNIISVGIVLVIAFVIYRKTKQTVQQQTVLNQLPTGTGVKKAKGYDNFIKNNPDFNEESFKANVKTAFMKIQDAWQSQDISAIRKFISDGVYQRFNTQFKMMQLLKQKNTLTDITVKNIYIDKIDSDGLYDIIHAAIHASINDNFVSQLDSSLNSGGKEEFVEYWSFMKKRGKPRVDIYQTDNCPNCGAPLPTDMGELSKCASCGTLTNSGEFDWVLSEITQADDYISEHPKLALSARLSEKIRGLIDENEDFSVQMIEDKASNGYLQMVTATALNDPSIMRRFVSDAVFEKVKGWMTAGTVAFNRIYLNDVYLIGVSETEGMHNLSIAIKTSFQRVKIDGTRVTILDPVVTSKTDVIIMSRDIGAKKSSGSIYAHSCPNCGAPVENSLDLKCKYCGSLFNSTGAEWIITGIMSAEEYEAYRSEHAADYSYSVSTSLIDKLYDVRDFAINNVMVVIAADGVIDQKERYFAEGIAKKWGYNLDKLEPFFTMAMNRGLVIRMPDNTKKREKIFALMEKAAAADENITPEEQQVLDAIRQQYGIGKSA